MNNKKHIAEIIEKLNAGAVYANEVAGWSYCMGKTFMKICANGKLKFYPNVEVMAKAIFRSQNTGI